MSLPEPHTSHILSRAESANDKAEELAAYSLAASIAGRRGPDYKRIKYVPAEKPTPIETQLKLAEVIKIGRAAVEDDIVRDNQSIAV